MSEAAVRQFAGAIASQQAAEADLLARLSFAFLVSEDDLKGGLPAIEAAADEIIAQASTLTGKALRDASERAEVDMVLPIIRWGEGRARLRDGWRDALGVRVEFYAAQVSDRLTQARDNYVAEVRRLLEEGDAFGWDDQTVLDLILDDVRKPGRAFGPFRTAVRDAVASVAGQAWTETWTAAWAALEAPVPPEALEQ